MNRLLFLAVAALLLVFAATVAVAAEDLDKSRQQLADIEQRLEKTLADIAKKKTVENDVLEDLGQVDRQLATLRRRVEREKNRLSELNQTVSTEKKELDKRKKGVKRLQAQVQKRLVALYKSEETGVLKTLFSAHDISRLLEDYDFLGRVVQHDRQLLDSFRDQVERQQAALKRMTDARKKQQTVTRRLKREEDALRRTVRLKKRYLAAVRKDQNALKRVATDLRARAERLNDLVQQLEAGDQKTTAAVSRFALQKGLLPWPVDGKIKTSFGTYKHAQLGTLLENHGIEILARPSTAVKAVWDGRIAFAKSFKGYGNLIIIDHGGGYYTLYAQVQRLQKKTDDNVEKGDLIAYSGFDNADHVYFEVRKGRTPSNPLLWIEKR